MLYKGLSAKKKKKKCETKEWGSAVQSRRNREGKEQSPPPDYNKPLKAMNSYRGEGADPPQI